MPGNALNSEQSRSRFAGWHTSRLVPNGVWLLRNAHGLRGRGAIELSLLGRYYVSIRSEVCCGYLRMKITLQREP
jgi:hypothetical protein